MLIFLYIAQKIGYKIKEVGIKWNEKEGSSVRPFKDGFNMLKDVLLVKFLHSKTKFK